jgi:hypothetical protein
MSLVSREEILMMLRAAACRHGGQARYAQHLGVSATFLSRMLAGNRNVTGKVLKDLGYERVIAYRKRPEADAHGTDVQIRAPALRAGAG